MGSDKPSWTEIRGSLRNWLVVWLPCFIFPLILGISSSQLTNSNLFQRGGQKPPTRKRSQEVRSREKSFFEAVRESAAWQTLSLDPTVSLSLTPGNFRRPPCAGCAYIYIYISGKHIYTYIYICSTMDLYNMCKYVNIVFTHTHTYIYICWPHPPCRIKSRRNTPLSQGCTFHTWLYLDHYDGQPSSRKWLHLCVQNWCPWWLGSSNHSEQLCLNWSHRACKPNSRCLVTSRRPLDSQTFRARLFGHEQNQVRRWFAFACGTPSTVREETPRKRGISHLLAQDIELIASRRKRFRSSARES